MRILISTIFIALLFVLVQNNPKPLPITTITPKKVTQKDLFLASVDFNNSNLYINRLDILHPTFRNKVITLIYECKKKGITLAVVETYRTPKRQNYLKSKHHTRLYGGFSKHQHFIAIDVVPIVKGRAHWNNLYLWHKIGIIGEQEGLLWGGRWAKLRDYGHFELPVDIDSIQYLVLPDTTLIPV